MRYLYYLFLTLICLCSSSALAQTLQAPRYYDVRFVLLKPQNCTFTSRYTLQARKALANAKSASLLYREQKNAAYGDSGLLLKAKGDYANIVSAMQNHAFYASQLSIKLNGSEVHNLAANTRFPEHNHIIITIMPGPIFKLHNINIASITQGKKTHYDETLFLPHNLGFRTGEPAKAPIIREAQTQILHHLAELGYSRPKILHNRITAQHQTNSIDIDILIDRGRKLYFSTLEIINTTPYPHLNSKLIAYFSGFTSGSLYTPKNREDIRHNLESLDLFSTVILRPGKNNSAGATPLSIIVTEKPLHSITAGLEFATKDGLGVNLTWLHRNLFGHGERLFLKAGGNAIDIDALRRKRQSPIIKHFGYDFTISFDKPGTWYYNAHTAASLRAWSEYTDYYNTKQLEAKAGIYKPLSEQWLGSAYVNLSDIRDRSDKIHSFGARHFHLIGLDTNFSLDKRDNNLSPSRGIFANIRLNPFYASGGGNLATRVELEGRSYLTLDNNANYILALRGKWGMLGGANLQQLPLSMQYFAGGSSSIRGYSYKSIGVICPADGKNRQCAVGGRSLGLTSAELRVKLWHKWGATGFVDSGYVGAKALDFKAKLKTGVGVGLRYNSGLGPLRLDIARPLHQTKNDPKLQLYIGIGEVF